VASDDWQARAVYRAKEPQKEAAVATIRAIRIAVNPAVADPVAMWKSLKRA